MYTMYLATIFVLSYLGPPLLCDRKAERREIEYLHKRLGCSRREKVPFFSWLLKVAFRMLQ